MLGADRRQHQSWPQCSTWMYRRINHRQLLMFEVFSVSEGPCGSAVVPASGTRASGVISAGVQV